MRSTSAYYSIRKQVDGMCVARGGRTVTCVSVSVKKKILSLCGQSIGKQVTDGMNWEESIIFTLPHLTCECYSLPSEYKLLLTCIVTWVRSL